MDSEIVNLVEYRCEKCGAVYKAKQGSKSKLCTDCLWKAITAPKPRKEEVKE